MPFGSSQWMYASGGFYNNVATQSLRFDDGSSAYLTRTPSSAGNRKTWTWSGWAKLGNPAVAYTLFSAGADGSNRTEIDWRSDSRLQIFTNTSGVLVGSIVWNPNKYRDPSAWYHLVFISDTTNATNTDRFRLYVNGSRVTGISGTSGENTFPSQNADTHINNTVAHSVGRLQHAANSYFDGYLTEVNFIDGQALDPSYFGEFKNGVWIPKAYTGSYGTNGFRLQFNQTGTGTASSSTIGADTSGVNPPNHFDSSAWYHVLIAFDTTQASSANRVKFYVNGTQHSLDNTLVSQNTDYNINNTTLQRIGVTTVSGSTTYLDGYLSEVNFIDGLSFFSDTSGTPNTSFNINSFGETKNGVWIAKKYTGSYGTNGFRLQFNQTGVGTASALTIGADTSGNTHHFTSSGIVASDCAMPDSPENNFATIDPLSSGAGVFSEGNLKYVSTADTGNTTFGISSGKVYAEVYVSSVSNSFIGVLDISNGLSPTRGGSFASHGAIAYKQDGNQYSLPVGGSSATASYGASYTNGDIIGIALNVDDDTITFYKNGSSQSATTNGVSHISSNGVYGFLLYASGTNFICNFGQDSSFAGNKTAQGNTDGNGIGDFYYAPPSGYLALCTSNLPEPTIGPNSGTNKQADDYFNTVLYNGNGGTQSITDVGFQSDWVWIKNRNGTGIHGLFDSSRGATKYLSSNSLDDEATASGVTSFDSKGFSLGSAFNQSSLTFVAWNWKANGDTTSTNDDGSIQSTVQANTDAGFSIVQYVATGSNATVGHGLSVEPDTVWIKNRDTDNRHWMSYWKPLGNTDRMIFNTGATASTSTSFNNTSPTSTVFSIGTSAHVNDASDNYIAYCFHSVEGYSKIGSYTGNGSTNGTFVYTGFEISFLMVKRAVGGTGDYSSWAMYDNKRKTINSDVGTDSNPLFANRSSQEGIRGNGSLSISGTRTAIDFLSNGFKLRDVANEIGVSGNTYIYMAFAKNPFKYANAK